MVDHSTRPKLAAILAADVAGYTHLMESDTDGTVAAWTHARDTIIDPSVAGHYGRVVKLTGDGFLAEFASVRCASDMQEQLAANPLDFRMGINLGDIVDDGRDIHGEGVNVAARLDESVAAYARAVDLAPDHADLRALYALALTFAEQPMKAASEAQAAMRLNPLDPGWYCGVLGHAYRYAGQFDDALAILSEYNRQSPGFGLVDIILTHADMGNAERAATYAKALIKARPSFTVATWEKTQNC